MHYGRAQLPRAHDGGVLRDGGGAHGPRQRDRGGGAVPVLRPDDGRGADEHGGRAAVRQDRARLRQHGEGREGHRGGGGFRVRGGVRGGGIFRFPRARCAADGAAVPRRAAVAADAHDCHRPGGGVEIWLR